MACRFESDLSYQIKGELAQLGEHLLCTQKVKSSNLLFSTTYRGIAQSGRALRLGRRSRWFESSYPDLMAS